MSTIDTQAFRAAFHGPIFEPPDVGYNDARRIWNAGVNKHPKLIAQCPGVADVIAAVHLLSALDIEAEEVIHTAFGQNLPRLAAIKNKYDPNNFFRVNYNIKPGLTQAGVA